MTEVTIKIGYRNTVKVAVNELHPEQMAAFLRAAKDLLESVDGVNGKVYNDGR